MITPPRWIERVLSSFGAEPDYRDALLGDLTEEFTIRVEEQGTAVARRWYFREAIRSVPHLLRSWLRRCGPRDVVQLFGVTVASWFVLRLLGMAIRLGIVLSFGVRPDSVSIIEAAWRDIVTETTVIRWVALALVQLPIVAAGFVGASLYPRGRLAAALCLNAVTLAFTLVAFVEYAGRISPIALVLGGTINMSLVLLGGLLRVLVARDQHARPHVSEPAG
jgi:hypothetical protein